MHQQSEPILRHHMTSLTPVDQLNDVTNDVRSREVKPCVSGDVTDRQTSMQRDLMVCICMMLPVYKFYENNK